MKGQVLAPILMLILLESTQPSFLELTKMQRAAELFPSFGANRNVKSLFLAQDKFHLVLAKGSHKLTLK